MDKLIDENKVEEFLNIVNNGRQIVIVPHVNPDGDAIGSALGLWHVLVQMGKQANVVVPNSFPDFLQWLNGSNKVIDFEKQNEKALSVFQKSDVMIMVDFNDFDRSEGLSDTLNAFSGKTIMIDHHPEPVAPCNLVISFPQVSSSCELLFRLIERAGLLKYVNQPAAEAIFTGMMTDTGNFSYNASDPETYRIIAALLEKGIDKDTINANVYHTFSEDRWRLIGHSLKEKMVVLHEYRTAYISLTNDELKQFNFQPGDTEGLVNYPLMVKGIVFCVLFMEKDDHVKLSLRSKGDFSVNQFARNHFDGGGHCNAAGGKTKLSMNDAIGLFNQLLPNYEAELLNNI
ncbi:MAG TPA: bifunctional oligoribonuclease/PAP phosphatase NrnA [Prolixibacteraceae bacterium]|nr:bifunctional oligoribonuclease/PAP phosphatase NrnA [Prolixibacteraceae bacterium]